MPIAGLVPPSLSGSFQSGPQIAQARDRLTQAVMNSGGMMMDSPSVADYGPTVFDPNALKDFRAAGENNDPYARLGARWAPDKVEMPINSSAPLNIPNVAPPANPETLQRAIANQPVLPQGGYRPGQLPLGGSHAPQQQPAAPPPMARIQRFFGGPAGGGMHSAAPTTRQLVFRRARFPGLR